MLTASNLKSQNKNIGIRPLISYALSSQALGQGGDHFQALTPLFAPIVAKNRGELFSAETLGRELESTYGLSVNEHIVNNFAEPMIKAGFLEKTFDQKHQKILRYAYELPADFDSQHEAFDKLLSSVLKKYHIFIKSMHTLATEARLFTPDQLEEGLINWLLRNDKRFDLSSEYQNHPKSELDFVASEFLQFLEKDDYKLFSDLALLHSGAIISEFVLDFKAPIPPRKKVTDLNVVLDAPFVMNLLSLSGARQHENALGLFEQLQKLGVQIHIFKHSCDEIESNIDGVLHPENTRKYGPLATAIARHEVFEDYVRMIRNHLEDNIRKLGIKIFDIEAYGEQRNLDKYFSTQHKDRFLEYIPRAPEKEMARERDAASVSAILRWRNGKNVNDFLQSKYLFVTNNNSLATQARKFCIDEGLLSQSHAPPVISTNTLAGILFLTLGDLNDRVQLSRKQLLSSCAKVAIIKPELVEGLTTKLSSLMPQHAGQIEAILKQPKTSQMILNLTWGNADLLNKDNAEEVFQSIIDEVSAEETKKYKSRLKAVNSENEKISNDNLSLLNEKNKIAQKLSSRAVKKINAIILIAKILISFVLLSAPIITTALVTQNVLIIFSAAFISALFGFFSFWFSPEFFSKKIIAFKIAFVNNVFNNNELQFDYQNYKIDYSSGNIEKRDDSLL